MNKREQEAGRVVLRARIEDVLDLIFTLANRDDRDPLVVDARVLVNDIERELARRP